MTHDLLSPANVNYVDALLKDPTDRNLAIVFRVLAYAFETRAENNSNKD